MQTIDHGFGQTFVEQSQVQLQEILAFLMGNFDQKAP